jgi:reactive intermediate/imine deaminase
MRRLGIGRLGLAVLGFSALMTGTLSPVQAQDAIGRIPARAGAPYSAATKVDGILYLSGQIGLGADGKLATGFEAQSKQVMDNIVTVLKGQGLTVDDVFKCTVMLGDMSKFAGFNEIYKSYFNPAKMPARSALGANGLAMGAEVEVECMAKAK